MSDLDDLCRRTWAECDPKRKKTDTDFLRAVIKAAGDEYAIKQEQVVTFFGDAAIRYDRVLIIYDAEGRPSMVGDVMNGGRILEDEEVDEIEGDPPSIYAEGFDKQIHAMQVRAYNIKLADAPFWLSDWDRHNKRWELLCLCALELWHVERVHVDEQAVATWWKVARSVPAQDGAQRSLFEIA